MTSLGDNIVSAIRQAIGSENAALHEPRFEGNEKQYVSDCIESTFVSSVGSYVDQFEYNLADYTGAGYAVAVVNGTSALQVSLQLAGVVKGDEVLVPAFSFVATANAVRYLGATPHFVDSGEYTLGLSPKSLRSWLQGASEMTAGGCRNRLTGARIRAVVPMHTFGHPCDMEGIMAVARDYRLELVEDAAESLGSFYQGQHTGTFGSLGAVSFNGNKILTTGGGGAILTNDKGLADHAKHLTTTAKIPHCWHYEHDKVGYNFRMPNINAALGCAQLEQLPRFIQSKRKLFKRYKSTFTSVQQVQLMQEPKDCDSNYWLQTIILDSSARGQRDEVLACTNNAGLATRPAWKLLSGLRPYRACPQAPLPVAESLVQRLVNIPSSAGLV